MNKKRLDTRTDLVELLEKVSPRTPLIETIISEAKAGEFHDYKNQKYACGKVAVVCLLTEAGLLELADRVRRGDFDEEADEQDKAEMRKLLPPKVWPVLGL